MNAPAELQLPPKVLVISSSGTNRMVELVKCLTFSVFDFCSWAPDYTDGTINHAEEFPVAESQGRAVVVSKNSLAQAAQGGKIPLVWLCPPNRASGMRQWSSITCPEMEVLIIRLEAAINLSSNPSDHDGAFDFTLALNDKSDQEVAEAIARLTRPAA